MRGGGAGVAWACVMVISNVGLMPLDRDIYGTEVLIRGEKQRFQRPFILEFVMFLAMASCLLLEVPGWRQRKREGGPGFWPSPIVLLKLLAPAVCDLVGSWFIFAGALWLSASVVEMLSCFNMMFTALLSILFLKKRIRRHEWFGIALSSMGVLAVSVAQLEASSAANLPDGAGSSTLLTCMGLALVIGAHFWYALEFVVAEKLFGESNVSAFMSVGVMGLWGIALFLPLFSLLRLTPTSPPTYAPLWHEDISESMAALWQQGLLLAVSMLFLALAAFNAAAFKTTQLMSALARVVFSSAVSPLVWLVDLLIAKTIGGHNGAAERLTAWSSLQLVGFILVIAGNFMYNVGGRSTEAAENEPMIDGGIS